MIIPIDSHIFQRGSNHQPEKQLKLTMTCTLKPLDGRGWPVSRPTFFFKFVEFEARIHASFLGEI